MKKLLVVLTTIAITMGLISVVYAETTMTPMYQLQDPINNQDGQRELRVNVNGGECLKVLGRDHNVYNATLGKLYTNNCKGPDYIGVAYNQSLNQLQILWVDTSDMLWLSSATEYKPLVQGIYTGGPINSINTTSATPQDTPIIQQPTGNQTSYNQMPNGNNTSKSGTGTFSYTYDRYTYKYKLNSKGELTYLNNVSSTVIADDAVAFGFAGRYVVYLNGDREMYAVELGRLSKGTLIMDYVDRMDYSSAGSNVVAGVVADGRTYSSSEIERLAKREYNK